MNYEKAIKAYQRLKIQLNRVPFRKELPRDVAAAITKKYSNWYDFLETQNDLTKSAVNKKMSRYIPNEQLISEINEIYKKLGYPPHRKDYKRTITAVNRFGGWRNFLKEAGIKATYVYNSQFSKEEIIYRVQQYIDKTGLFPVTDDIPIIGVSIDTVLRLFGGLDNLYKYFNGVPRKKYVDTESRENEVLKAAQYLKDNNRVITRVAIAQLMGVSVSKISAVVNRYKYLHNIKSLSFIEYMKINGFDAVRVKDIKKEK